VGRIGEIHAALGKPTADFASDKDVALAKK
jgi:hypothetical protein